MKTPPIIILFSMGLIFASQAQKKQLVTTVRVKIGDSISRTIKRGEKHIYTFDLSKDSIAIFHIVESGVSGANVKAYIGDKIVFKEHIDNWGQQNVHFLGLDSLDRQLTIVVDTLDRIPDEGTYSISFVSIEPMTKEAIGEWLGNLNYSETINLSRYVDQDSLKRAIEELQNTLQLVKDELTRANILALLGQTVYDFGGYHEYAIELIARSQALYKRLGHQYGVASMSYQLSNVYFHKGNKVKNLEYAREALEMFQSLKSSEDIALVYNDMGLSYSILESEKDAKRYYLLAKHSIRNKKSPLYGTICNNIGLQFMRENEPDSAVYYLEIASKLRGTKYSQEGRLQSLTNLAVAYQMDGKIKRAISILNVAVAIADANKISQYSIISRASLVDIYYYSLHDLKKAMAQAENALEVTGDISNAITAIHHTLAHIQIDKANWKEALNHARLLENDRLELEHLNRQSHQAINYVEGRLEHFHMKLRCYMELSRLEPSSHWEDSAALTSQKIKGRIFVSESSLQPAQKKLILADASIKQLSDSISLFYDSLFDPELKYDKLLALRNSYYDARLKLLSEPSESRADLPKLALPNNAIDIVLGEKESYAWVITHGQIKSFFLPGIMFFQSAVNKIIGATSEFFEATTDERKHEMEAIVKKEIDVISNVLRPVISQLDTGRVWVVRDGPLELIPFQLINMTSEEGKYQPAVLNTEFCYLPTFRLFDQRKTMRTTADDMALAVADPVYNSTDTRLLYKPRKRKPVEFNRLIYSTNESKKIVRNFSNKRIVTGFNASKQSILAMPLEAYRYIHFSTHAVYDLTDPELSSIILCAYDSSGRQVSQRLFAFEIQDLAIDADLVVLGSCYSAFGVTNTAEGVLSLDRSMLVAGARGVISTSWSIPDRFSSDFFSTFYDYHRNLKLSSSRALRKAQIDFLETSYSSPLYWGAFSYSGI